RYSWDIRASFMPAGPGRKCRNKNEKSRPLRGLLRLSKKSKTVAVGGHAPTTATPTGKFYAKLCARNAVTSARFGVKFCRRGYTRGNSRVRQSPCAAAAPCAACRVSRHAAQAAARPAPDEP